jgi:hypothetical protein
MLKTKTIKVVSVQDWDDLVTKTYGKPYMFQQQDGCKPRGTDYFSVPSEEWDGDCHEDDEIPFEVNGKEMGVTFESWLKTNPEDTRKHFNSDWENRLFWERNFYPHLEMIVNDLHAKGLLEEGEYMIDIDW